MYHRTAAAIPMPRIAASGRHTASHRRDRPPIAGSSIAPPVSWALPEIEPDLSATMVATSAVVLLAVPGAAQQATSSVEAAVAPTWSARPCHGYRWCVGGTASALLSNC